MGKRYSANDQRSNSKISNEDMLAILEQAAEVRKKDKNRKNNIN